MNDSQNPDVNIAAHTVEECDQAMEDNEEKQSLNCDSENNGLRDCVVSPFLDEIENLKKRECDLVDQLANNQNNKKNK